MKESITFIADKEDNDLLESICTYHKNKSDHLRDALKFYLSRPAIMAEIAAAKERQV